MMLPNQELDFVSDLVPANFKQYEQLTETNDIFTIIVLSFILSHNGNALSSIT
jgi:hypothetical protein